MKGVKGSYFSVAEEQNPNMAGKLITLTPTVPMAQATAKFFAKHVIRIRKVTVTNTKITDDRRQLFSS